MGDYGFLGSGVADLFCYLCSCFCGCYGWWFLIVSLSLIVWWWCFVGLDTAAALIRLRFGVVCVVWMFLYG